MGIRAAIISSLLIMGFSAILSPSAVCGEEKDQTGAGDMWISGKVIWPEHDLTKASVKVFKDPKFKDLYTEGLLLKPNGTYALTFDDPGTYYIVAFVDDNGSNRFDAGDGMGIYGVTDWADADQKAKPVRLENGVKLPGIDVQITAVVDDQGRMRPISVLGSSLVTGVSGKLIWQGPSSSSSPLEKLSPSPPLEKLSPSPPLEKLSPSPPLEKPSPSPPLEKPSLSPPLEKPSPSPPLEKPSPSPPFPKGGEGGFSNAIVFAYSDPSWSNRIAQTNVRETGEYEISVPAGRYYLLAVIDENGTNLLDVGDKFGIWGMTRFGVFPKAVEVHEGHVTENRNILIIGQMGISGKPMPLDVGVQKQDAGRRQGPKVAPLGDRIVLSGNVIWPGSDLKHGMVQAYSDPSMTVAAAFCKLEPDDKGRFQLVVPAGDYYIMAGVDADGDGKYTTGDGIGAYGAANAADQMPEKLTVTEHSKNDDINLVITAEFDSSGQLKPISQYSMPVGEGFIPSRIQHPASGTQYTGISGKIAWEGRKISKATLIFSDEPRFESGVRTPLQLDEDGLYNCLTPPGDYYIMAIVDFDGNDQTDAGDGIGLYGAEYWDAPQKVTVLDGRMTPYININITVSFGPDGKTVPIQTRGSIRFQYGEPDDVYTDHTVSPSTQEWWYWDKGVAFTFEETDAGWNLIDTYEFTPIEADSLKEASRPSQAEIPPHPPLEKRGGDFDGTIYYTFGRNIWAMGTDGANRRWTAPGTRPTATSDGDKLLFLDTSGNIYLVEPGNDASVGARHASPLLVLSRRKVGFQPAISHDGKVAAFTRDSGGYRRVILKNLETGEESAIPTGAMDLYHPAWSQDDELVAYSASPPSSSDRPDRNRDIYYYDLVAGRTERVSTSPLDEFDPAWSPVGKRVLVYCRAEADHAQLWIANFDADGKPIERQLTKYGGRNPAWSPGGDRIIYENNAQLWTIKPDGADEAPIVVDGEPIFGLDPFWTR